MLSSLVAITLGAYGQIRAQTQEFPSDCDESEMYMGRCEGHGFFTNMTRPFVPMGGDFGAFYEGVVLISDYIGANNVDQFVDILEENLYLDYSGCEGEVNEYNPCTQNKARAKQSAHIVLTMLGYPIDDDFGDVETAKEELAEWEARVRYYDDRGWVEYNEPLTFEDGPSSSPYFYGHDIAWLDTSSASTFYTLRFINPDGTTFNLVKNCGNLRGAIWPLASPGLEPTLTSPQEGSRYDEFSGDIVVAGEVENMGGVSTEGREVNVELTISRGGNLVEPLDGQSSIRKGRPWQNGGWSYSGSGNTNQYFTPNNTFASTDSYTAFTRVREDLNTGGEVCFRLTVTPHTSSSSSSASDEVCIIVEVPDRPFVTTRGGDVHGGAVLVDPALSREACRMEDEVEADVRGQVRPFPPHGSRSTYAVSATGSITNFGSGGVAHGNTLTFGNTPDSGSYRTVCRPDLTSLNYYRSLGFPVIETDASFAVIIFGINQGTWDNSVIVSTRSQITAGNTSLNAGRQATIVAMGDLTINGNITTSGGVRSSASDIPALALVSAGDINITSNATSIRAYLSSNGTINTCSNVDLTTEDIGPCNAGLDIRGALLAETILFRRTGGDFRGGDPAETITHAPELYLSPPPGLFGLTNNIFAETPVRERPPRF